MSRHVTRRAICAQVAVLVAAVVVLVVTVVTPPLVIVGLALLAGLG